MKQSKATMTKREARKLENAIIKAINQGYYRQDPVYMLLYNWCDDWESTSCEKCLFHAVDDREAQHKAIGWADYHSFSRSLVRARLATEAEIGRDPSWYHDDWMD